MNSLLSTVIAIAGLIVASIIIYNLVTHGDATVGILKASGGFVTKETSVLEGQFG